jgi:PKD repeat protein
MLPKTLLLFGGCSRHQRALVSRAMMLVTVFAMMPHALLRADCSLTRTGNIPLNDLGPVTYKGFIGGLYPSGSNTRPATHNNAGLDIANNQIKPLNASGNPDSANGKIVMISVGMSNATQEFASKGTQNFKSRADADPAKNPQLVIVDGAQGGQDAPAWIDPNAATWSVLNQRLTAAGVTPQQVEVTWLKEALIRPNNYGAFPAHAKALQTDLEIILRNLKAKFPNIKIAYLSTRTRAYTNIPTDLNPEPFAYETGFAFKWTVEDQINGAGNLNFDATKGAVTAPLISWGPYIWADGLTARSDGFTWLCSDLESDFTHPSATGGVPKVADQLLAFFKTDPTATPWFLRKTISGQPPTVTAGANVSSGAAPLSVNFTASASDPDGTIAAYQWTFDDGTFSTAQNPAKTFPAPGNYSVHLTVTDNSGNIVMRTVPIYVASPQFLNISTRMQVLTGNEVPIDGFIITGTDPKKVIVRGLGPSLSGVGAAALPNPTLELHQGSTTLATNDDWKTKSDGSSQQAEVEATTIPPTNDLESAIVATLNPGAYTAILAGRNGTTGVGLVEVYDLAQAANSRLTNISTRGFVDINDNVMIAGLIVGGSGGGGARVLVRAIGPSLSSLGIQGTLPDPMLELHDGNGVTIATNDNWKTRTDGSSQQTQIEATTIPPTNDLESALVQTLSAGNYTAIVRGKANTIGIGLVEAYNLP